MGRTGHRRRIPGGLLSDGPIRTGQDLYALPPDEFIAARDALANELKSSGATDQAAQVKKLRKPSVVAWAVNVAARERPEDVEALLEAGAALRRAQRKALSGAGREDLRLATDERRSSVQGLTDAAVDAVGDRGAAHRDAIAATLEAASVDDEVGERLRTGTLDREARPAAGFGAVEGFELLVGGGVGEAPPSSSADREAEARDKAREARATAQRAATAERAADKARRRADDLKEKAAAASSAARDAEAEAKRLTDEAKMDRKRAERAAKDADAAARGS